MRRLERVAPLLAFHTRIVALLNESEEVAVRDSRVDLDSIF
jgi:hypothetical protein